MSNTTEMQDRNKSQKSPEEIRKALEQTRPSKIELKQAIEKSIKKNKETLKILAKR